MGAERGADRMDTFHWLIIIKGQQGQGQLGEWGGQASGVSPLWLLRCMALHSRSISRREHDCCSTGPKLGGTLDSANHSGWPYGILSLIAWHWAYCSDGTPIKQKKNLHPISAIQTV